MIRQYNILLCPVGQTVNYHVLVYSHTPFSNSVCVCVCVCVDTSKNHLSSSTSETCYTTILKEEMITIILALHPNE